MKILKRLLNSSLFLILLFLFSCDGQENENISANAIAKINDTLLVVADLESIVFSNPAKTKKEYIKQMVDREILYLAAKENDLLKSPEYLRVMNNTMKDIAASFYIKYYLDKQAIEISEKEIENFYNEHKEQFLCHTQQFYFNIAEFYDPSKAYKFQTEANKSNWNQAEKLNLVDSIKIKNNLFKYDYEVEPDFLLNVLEDLTEGEISICIEGEQGSFYVVQLIEKYTKNQIPSINALKNLIKERIEMEKQKLNYEELLNQLYKKYKVEIIKD